jgi:hypothetical protein
MTDSDNITKFNWIEARNFIYNKKNLLLWKPKNIRRDNQIVLNNINGFCDMYFQVLDNVKRVKGKDYESDEFHNKLCFLESLSVCWDDDDETNYFVRRLYDAIEYGIKYLKIYNVESFLDIPDDHKYEVGLDCITECLKGIDLNGERPCSTIFPSCYERKPFDMKKLKFVDQDTQDVNPRKCLIM